MSPAGRKDVVAKVEAVLEDILSSRSDGLGLDRVEYRRAGRHSTLRVFLDHPEAVTVGHCEEISRRLAEELDAGEIIPGSYLLEVSSPGVERPLTGDVDFERFRGRLVTLQFYGPVDGRKEVTGRLLGLDSSGNVRLETASTGERSYPRAKISRAHLSIDWSRKSKANGDGGGEQ